jgi:hypothetical protein
MSIGDQETKSESGGTSDSKVESLKLRLSGLQDVVSKYGLPTKSGDSKDEVKEKDKSLDDGDTKSPKKVPSKQEQEEAKKECDLRGPILLQKIAGTKGRYMAKQNQLIDPVKSEYESAYKLADYVTAVDKLDGLDDAFLAAEKSINEHFKGILEGHLNKRDKAKLTFHDNNVSNGTYDRFAWGSGWGAEYDKRRKAAMKLMSNDDYEKANGAYGFVVTWMGEVFERSMKREVSVVEAQIAYTTKAIDDKAYSDEMKLVGDCQGAFKDLKAIQNAAKFNDWHAGTAMDQLTGIVDSIAALRKSKTDKLLEANSGGKKIGDIVSKAKTMVKKDPHVLNALALDPKGRKLLDDMVASLGENASGADGKKLCAAAIEARYGLKKIEGDLSTKAMPKLYAILSKVPESHTLGNERMQTVKRDRNSDEASFYRAKEDLIVLNLGRQGKRHDKPTADFDHDDNVPAEYLQGQKKDIDYFNHTTLHEVGHAVDAKMRFMDTRGSADEYGGWQKHTVQEIADVAAEMGDFYGSFSKLPATALKSFLVALLQKKDVAIKEAVGMDPKPLESDPAIAEAIKIRNKNKKTLAKKEGEQDSDYEKRQKAFAEKHLKSALKKSKLVDEAKRLVLGEAVKLVLVKDVKDPVAQAIKSVDVGLDDKAAWDDLLKHDSAKWCRAVRLVTPSQGLWDEGKDGAKQAIKGRIYQEAYGSDWYSYTASSRSKGVSSYQFRAPAEWFAELYTAYYLDNLTDKHPAYKWLDNEVDKLAS